MQRTRLTDCCSFALALCVLCAAFPIDATAADRSQHGAGVCRDTKCAKPAETPPACTQADKDKIKGLIGRLHGLKDAAKEIRKGFNDNNCSKDALRDEIWGPNGSISKFSRTLPGMVPGEGAVSEVWNWGNIVVSISEEPDSAGAWGEAGKEVAEKVIENDTVKKEIIRKYVQDSAEWASGSNNYKKAASKYFRDATKGMEAFEKGLKALNFILAAKELAEAANDLDGKLADWIVADKEAASMQAQLDKIDKQIQQTSDEIAKLRAKCPGEGAGSLPDSPASDTGTDKSPCEGKDKDKESESGREKLYAELKPFGLQYEESLHGDATRGDFMSVQWNFQLNGPFLANARTLSANNDRELSRKALKARGELRALRPLLQKTIKRLHERIYPALAPFSYGLTKEAPSSLFTEIIKIALPDLQALQSDMHEIIKHSNNTVAYLSEKTNTASRAEPAYYR